MDKSWGKYQEGPQPLPQAHQDMSAIAIPLTKLAKSISKGWGKQKPGAGGCDNIIPKQASPALWRTTQICLSHSWQSCWRRNHAALSHYRTPLWPPSHCQLSWTAMRHGRHAHGPMALPLTSPAAQGVAEGSQLCQEKVTHIKSMCLCVIKPDAVSSSHHPHRGVGQYLQCSPQRSSHTAGGLAGQKHLSRHTPPRWLHHIPSEHGNGLEETCTDTTGTITSPRGPARLSQLAPNLTL